MKKFIINFSKLSIFLPMHKQLPLTNVLLLSVKHDKHSESEPPLQVKPKLQNFN
jgi:hypothetical protein